MKRLFIAPAIAIAIMACSKKTETPAPEPKCRDYLIPAFVIEKAQEFQYKYKIESIIFLYPSDSTVYVMFGDIDERTIPIDTTIYRASIMKPMHANFLKEVLDNCPHCYQCIRTEYSAWVSLYDEKPITEIYNY